MTTEIKKHKHFSIVHHVPHYSKILFQAVRSPLLIYFAAAGNLVLLLCSSLFYLAERGSNPNVKSFFDAIWWAFSTVSTVGFGDIAPITISGRLVGIFLMIFGVVFFVGFTAILISIIFSLTAKEIAENEALTVREYEKVMAEIRKLSAKLDKFLEKQT
jgi:voltage-gated potassium channel